jgi:hypothetical protein
MLLSLLDPVVELSEADEITRRILAKQSVSEDEFRYVVMFNLTAMTQLLWELSNSKTDPPNKRIKTTLAGSHSMNGPGEVRKKVTRIVPFAALVAFLAGLGLGYLIP